MKPFHRRSEYVNLLVDQEREEIEEDAGLSYILANPIELEFTEIVRESELETSFSRADWVFPEFGKVFPF